jgi:hypothetical protein
VNDWDVRKCLNNLGSGPFLYEQRFFAVDIYMIPFVDFFVQCILHDVLHQRIEQPLLAMEHEAMLHPLPRAVDIFPFSSMPSDRRMAVSATTPLLQGSRYNIHSFTWPRTSCFPARDLASTTHHRSTAWQWLQAPFPISCNRSVKTAPPSLSRYPKRI